MAQADRIYKEVIRKHFTNHEANYPPSREVKLGDYGTFEHGYFTRKGNIRDNYNIQFEIRLDPSPSYEQFESSGKVSTKFVAKGSVGAGGVPVAKAAVEIGFSAEDSYYFSSPEVQYNEIEKIAAVGTAVLELYKRGEWEKRHVIVTRVMEGKNLLMVISGSSSANVTVEAQSPEIPNLDLTDASVMLAFGNNSLLSYKTITNGVAQIALGFCKVYNPLFQTPKVETTMLPVQQFEMLDSDKSIDENNIVFGNIMAENYI